METEKHTSLKLPPDESALMAAKLKEDVARLSRSLQQQARKTRVLSAIAVLLVAGVIGMAWVGSPLVTEQGGLRKRLPLAQASLDSMSGRLGVAETKLSSIEKGQPVLTDRIGKLESSTTAGIRRARTESIALTEGVKRDMNQNLAALDSRIGGIESTQQEAHVEVAALNGDLDSVKSGLSEARASEAEQAGRIRELGQAQLSTGGRVAGLENGMSADRGKINSLSSEVDRQRIDFEVSKNKADEVVKGVYLTVNKTDVGRQQLKGWLHIVSDGSIVWLQDVGAQHPISFASQKDTRPYELVVTKVLKNGVVGYLLVPQSRTESSGN